MSTVTELGDPREIRPLLGLNQQQFWSRIRVTQSGGSRYGSGRHMPRPVRELLRLVHVEQIDIQRIRREDPSWLELTIFELSEISAALGVEPPTGKDRRLCGAERGHP